MTEYEQTEYEHIVSLLDDYENAVRPRPGKFEGNTDARIAEALYSMTLDGSLDADYGSVDEYGWYGLIGRFVVSQDSYGFFGYQSHVSDDDARESFEDIIRCFPA